MRIAGIIFIGLFLFGAGSAAAQTGGRVSIQAAGGPTVIDEGYHVSGAVGFSPTSRITLLLDVERTHVFSRSTFRDGVSSKFRGGTLTSVAGEFRVSLFPHDRITPYGFVGLGAGHSRPNVNELFPNPGNNADMRVGFAGAGIHAPIGAHASAFADGRLLIGAGTEADSFMGAVPIRIGLSWRF